MAKRIDASKMELKEKVVEINRVTKTTFLFTFLSAKK